MIYFVSDRTSRQLPFRAPPFFVCIEGPFHFSCPNKEFFEGLTLPHKLSVESPLIKVTFEAFLGH